MGKARVSLVYVADFEKYDAGRGTSDATVQTAWSNAHAGFIPQNVYLFAHRKPWQAGSAPWWTQGR